MAKKRGKPLLKAGQDVTMAMLLDIAATRGRIHRADKSHRPLSGNNELIGLLGQRQFSVESGMPMDVSIRHEGDGGLNFTTPGGKTIHVTTARQAVHLLREVDKPTADIHVLAQVNGDLDGAELVGWEWDRIMLLCPVRAMPGQTIQNHVMRAVDLRPIEDLLAMVREGM